VRASEAEATLEEKDSLVAIKDRFWIHARMMDGDRFNNNFET